VGKQRALGCYLAVHRAGVEPATSGLPDWHDTVTPSHKLQKYGKLDAAKKRIALSYVCDRRINCTICWKFTNRRLRLYLFHSNVI